MWWVWCMSCVCICVCDVYHVWYMWCVCICVCGVYDVCLYVCGICVWYLWCHMCVLYMVCVMYVVCVKYVVFVMCICVWCVCRVCVWDVCICVYVCVWCMWCVLCVSCVCMCMWWLCLRSYVLYIIVNEATYFWIGLLYHNGQGVFMWTHTQTAAVYTNWYTNPKELPPFAGNCVDIGRRILKRTWNTRGCSMTFQHPLCKKD